MKINASKKEKYEAPKLIVLGNGKDLILGFTGVNTEWTSSGNTKSCAGCLS